MRILWGTAARALLLKTFVCVYPTLEGSFAKEPYERDHILKKRPIYILKMRPICKQLKTLLKTFVCVYPTLEGSFAKEPYERDDILKKRPIYILKKRPICKKIKTLVLSFFASGWCPAGYIYMYMYI